MLAELYTIAEQTERVYELDLKVHCYQVWGKKEGFLGAFSTDILAAITCVAKAKSVLLDERGEKPYWVMYGKVKYSYTQCHMMLPPPTNYGRKDA